MNHYPRHVGDWMTATAHLTAIEECMYSRMVDQYYAREAPLPTDVGAVCRLVRAASAVERKAVQAVLTEFFTEGADGWHQKRCDAEIAAYHEGDEAREQKQEHERERAKRHRDERKRLFEELRQRGEVPPFDTPTKALRDRLARVISLERHATVTRDAAVTSRERTDDITANQNQNQNQNHKLQKHADPDGSDGEPSPIDPKKVMFDLGVRLLTAHGEKEASARSFVARLARDYGEAEVTAKFGYLAANPKVEPKSYLIAALRPATPEQVYAEKLRALP